MSQFSKHIRIGSGVGFSRYRRITGYLTATLERWNGAKRNEEKERVKHPKSK